MHYLNLSLSYHWLFPYLKVLEGGLSASLCWDNLPWHEWFEIKTWQWKEGLLCESELIQAIGIAPNTLGSRAHKLLAQVVLNHTKKSIPPNARLNFIRLTKCTWKTQVCLGSLWEGEKDTEQLPFPRMPSWSLKTFMFYPTELGQVTLGDYNNSQNHQEEQLVVQ